VALTELRNVLASASFRKLFGVRLSGQFADGLVQSALATFVLFSPERQATAPRIAVAFVILLLPYSLIGPFVGVYIDRWPRRAILISANVVRAAMTMVLAALVLASHDGPDLAIAVLVTLGVGRFVLAALSAALPHTVEPAALVTANALAPTSGTIAASLGGLIGVGIRAIEGGGDRGSMLVLAFAALMYLVASGVGTLITRNLLGPHGEVVGQSARDVVAGLVDGFRHLRERPAARDAILVVTGHRITFGAATVLVLLILRNTLNSPTDPTGALASFTKVIAFAAAGALIAALLTPWATRRIGSVPWIVGTLLGAATIGVFGLLGTTLNWSVLGGMSGLFVAAVGVGFSGQAVKVTADTIVQQAVSDDHRGRVFSLYDVAVNIGLIIGVTWVAFTAPTSGISVALDLAIPAVLAISAICYAIASRRRGLIA